MCARPRCGCKWRNAAAVVAVLAVVLAAVSFPAGADEVLNWLILTLSLILAAGAGLLALIWRQAVRDRHASYPREPEQKPAQEQKPAPEQKPVQDRDRRPRPPPK